MITTGRLKGDGIKGGDSHESEEGFEEDAEEGFEASIGAEESDEEASQEVTARSRVSVGVRRRGSARDAARVAARS